MEQQASSAGDSAEPEGSPSGPPRLRVRYDYFGPLPDVLGQLRCSLLISTYQAGKLIALGRDGDDVALSFHGFNQAMGVAARPGALAVGLRDEIAFLADTSQLARYVEPEGRYDRLYLHRSTTKTGPIQCHEMAWSRDEQGHWQLWVVNTGFSCLCTLDERFSFVPQWRPPFISALRPGDRCHLNGLGMRDGRPAVVTAMAQSDVPRGWSEHKNETGLVWDLASEEPITVGLAMPHSPRFHRGRLYVLNSGHGTLETIDPATGERTVVAALDGFTRGLALYGNLAFVGLSRIRETRVFGGVPIAARHEELRCGVGVVDLDTGRVVSRIEFTSGIEEIFDVQVVPDAVAISLGGESAETGDQADIWVIPPEPGQAFTRIA